MRIQEIYVRTNGIITGPFSRERALSLVQLGMIDRTSEYSQDKKSWRSIADILPETMQELTLSPEKKRNIKTAECAEKSPNQANQYSFSPVDTPAPQTDEVKMTPVAPTAAETGSFTLLFFESMRSTYFVRRLENIHAESACWKYFFAALGMACLMCLGTCAAFTRFYKWELTLTDTLSASACALVFSGLALMLFSSIRGRSAQAGLYRAGGILLTFSWCFVIVFSSAHFMSKAYFFPESILFASMIFYSCASQDGEDNAFVNTLYLSVPPILFTLFFVILQIF